MTAPIEIINPPPRRRGRRLLAFDFDGTVSLLREDWLGIMTEQVIGELTAAGVRRPDLEDFVRTNLLLLNGRPTLVQMQWLAGQLGPAARPAGEYGREFQSRLLAALAPAYADLESGRASPREWAVPGVHDFLAEAAAAGLGRFLVSGTVGTYVRPEAGLLQVADSFADGMFMPDEGDSGFAKQAVMERVLARLGLDGGQLIGFGDGVGETAAVKALGGVAVGVASVPRGQTGIHAEKRERLIAAGADIVIADFTQGPAVWAALGLPTGD